MYEAVKNFASQFTYEPEIQSWSFSGEFDRYIVAGMGGSGLAAQLLQTWSPEIPLEVYQNYSSPLLFEKIGKTLIIAISYSGNTEEVISVFNAAIEAKHPVIAVAVGGKLLELAKKYSVPFITLPNTGIQPRAAIGYMIRALLKILNNTKGLEETSALADSLNTGSFEDRGKALAGIIQGKIPIIYSSERNRAVAYNWKISFNETGKIPAFYNIFPELNHNEMIGYGIAKLAQKFQFIFLRDDQDNTRIVRRMDLLEEEFKKQGHLIENVFMHGKSEFEKIFSSIVLAWWAAYYIAQSYGQDSEEVNFQEDFKKQL